MSINLTFLRPDSSESTSVEWIEVETQKGNLVIQRGHAPSSIILKQNSFVIWSLSTGAIEKIKVERAFLKVDRHSCLLIIDSE